MTLSAKPDFERAATAWNHFWNGEVYERPLVLASCHIGPGPAIDPRRDVYYHGLTGAYEAHLDLIDRHLEETVYLGEMMPAFRVDHGPDQYAAFLGATLRFPDSTASRRTNWAEPIVEDWDDFLPIRLDPNNATFQSVLRFARLMAKRAEGRYLVRAIDTHSHADTLSALRGPERFTLDFLERPERVERAMADMRRIGPVIYDAIYEAGNMGGPKGCSQIVWSEGKCGVIQCDYIIMLGPEHFRRFILPAIEEEAAHRDHCLFHLDGPGAFRHLDDLLAVKDIDVIQLVPGAGQPPAHTWVDHLKRCLAAGKGVQVYGAGLNLERIKVLHRELGPRGVMYCPSGRREQIEEIMAWLKANT